MPLWDQLRGLELNIEDVTTERKSVEVSTQFTRVTTTVVLGGEGEHGRGEDVTYTPEDHDWFPDLEARGRTTLGELSAELDGLRLFETEPAMPAWADYRRWAFESAALDLALRQNDLSLGAAVKRDYHPVRFVVSTRGDAFGWLEHIPGVELKLDPENDWDRPFMERLAATGSRARARLQGVLQGHGRRRRARSCSVRHRASSSFPTPCWRTRPSTASAEWCCAVRRGG